MAMLFLILITLTGLIFLYFFLVSPNNSRSNQVLQFDHTAFAHRGLHNKEKLIPENSMLAFKEAVKYNQAIELDVHLTKDHKVVVFHDDTLNRVCQVSGTIEAMTYAQLSTFHLLNTNEQIPLLADVLNYINGRVPLLIEIKLPQRETDVCKYTYELLEHYKGPYLIQSFNTIVLIWFKNNAPSVLRGQLSSNLTKDTPAQPYIARFTIRYLLLNCLGKPDFISYKLKDTRNLSLALIRFFFKTPIAVWTIRNEKDFAYASSFYNMVIFENLKI